MPDYLDDLVRSANGATAEARPPLPEGGPRASAEPPGAASARAASQAAGETVVREEQRQEALEVPPEIRTERAAPAPIAAAGMGGDMGEEGPAPQHVSRAGRPERQMSVISAAGDEQGLDAIAAVLGRIATVGVPPGPGTVGTQAIGSKI